MNAIGGYLSLELPFHEEYHKDAINLNTGRNCLEYILRARKYKKVYIPYYTCDVILEPFLKLKIDYEFYHINFQFEIVDKIQLKCGEALLYTNYFGLKQRYVQSLAGEYGNALIIDNTQAFYAKPINHVDTFYTCRKFFGVPDGAYLYTEASLDDVLAQDSSYNRMTHLLKRLDLSAEDGYEDFRCVDNGFVNQPIRKMSNLTHRLMQSIDYVYTYNQRRSNFKLLHNTLQRTNYLQFSLEDDSVPMVYPYFSSVSGLREFLIHQKVFVAKYWSNVLEWVEGDCVEKQLTQRLLPLPIDQRYGVEEMEKVLKNISYLYAGTRNYCYSGGN